jgi:hypothetical protein
MGVRGAVHCSAGWEIIVDDRAMPGARDPVSVMMAGAAILADELPLPGSRSTWPATVAAPAATSPRAGLSEAISTWRSISAIRWAWSRTDGAIACSATLITWPGWERLAPTPAMALAHLTLSVTWPGIWPARCRASATAIAAGMNAASRQPGSHAVESSPDTRRPKARLTSINSSRHYAGDQRSDHCPPAA